MDANELHEYYSVLGVVFTLLGVVSLFGAVKAPKPNMLGYFGFLFAISGQLMLLFELPYYLQ